MTSIDAQICRPGWLYFGKPRNLWDYIDSDPKHLALILGILGSMDTPIPELTQEEQHAFNQQIKAIDGGLYGEESAEVFTPAAELLSAFKPLERLSEHQIDQLLVTGAVGHFDAETIHAALAGFLRFLTDAARARESIQLFWA